MTATDLKKRAIALAEKTKIDSVTPEEVGQLSNDIVEYIENVEINGSSLGIRKTYTSVSAMEADSTAPKDDKGVLLRRGMLVNIYNQEYPESADNGKVFSFQNPGWAFRGTVDAGYATKEELTELDKKIGNIDINVVYQVNVGGTIIIPISDSVFKKNDLIRFSVVDDSGAITNYKFMTENGKNIFLTTTFSPNQVYELPVWTEGTAPMRIVINSEYILKDGKITINVEPYYYNNLDKRFSDKQDVLESGVNVKTVNGQSILGSGNIDLPSSSMVYAGALAAINVSNAQDAIDKAIEVLGNATYREVEINVGKDGFYIGTNGKEISAADGQLSTPIALKKGEIMFFTCTGLLNMSNISIKLDTTVNDSPTTYYVSIAGQKAEQFTYYFISPIDCNVVLSYLKTSPYKCFVANSIVQDIYKDKIISNKYSISAKGAIVCPLSTGTLFRVKVVSETDGQQYQVTRETIGGGFALTQGSAASSFRLNANEWYYFIANTDIRQLYFAFFPTLSSEQKVLIDILPESFIENISSDITILVFGDSISDTTSVTVGINTIQKYIRFIQAKYGFEVIDCARWGTGFLQKNSANDPCLPIAIENNKETQADDILIAIGVNDYINNSSYQLGDVGSEVFDIEDPYNTENNLCGAIDYSFSKIVEYWGDKAKIGVILPLPCHTATSGNEGQVNCLTNNAMGFNLKDLVEKIEYYCVKYSIPYLDMFRHSGFYVENTSFRQNNTYTGFVSTGDGLHPLTDWHRNVYTPKVEEFIKNL